MQRGDIEILATFNKRLDATFIGTGDSEGNQPLSDLRDAYKAFYITQLEKYDTLDIVRCMDGYKAPEQIRSCEETAQYVLRFPFPLRERCLPPLHEPTAWGVVVGDALQRVLIRRYDDYTGDDGWDTRSIVSHLTWDSFFKNTPRGSGDPVVDSVEIPEGVILNQLQDLPGNLSRLVFGFITRQQNRISALANNPTAITPHVYLDRYPRIHIRYIDSKIKIFAKGYLSVAK